MHTQPADSICPPDVAYPPEAGHALDSDRIDQLEEAIELFELMARSDGHDLPSELRSLAALFLQLGELTEDIRHGGAADLDAHDSPADFLIEAAETIKSSVNADPASLEGVVELKRLAVARWGDQLSSDHESELEDVDLDWQGSAQTDGWADDEADAIAAPSEADITRMLAALGQSSAATPETAERSESVPEPTASVASQEPCDPEDPPLEGELREAFLDDAERCVASLEESLLTLEAQPGSLSPLRQILRELHTLKGASGSVGLTGLATFIHELEESLREAEEAQTLPSIQSLLAGVDTIRRRVDDVRSPGQSNTDAPGKEGASDARGNDHGAAQIADASTADRQPDAGRAIADYRAPLPASSPAPSAQRFEDASTDEETVRVRTSQLNRLMDLLSQLVMLRNRRGMELSDLEEIHHQMIHAVSRLRVLGDEGLSARMIGPIPTRSIEGSAPQLPRVNEITNDLFESAQRLRSCFRPVTEGNAAVSQFIRQFRQELVELQRTPVTGLFRRLRRAIRDAARVEEKQVELSWVGEETGIERSLQEKVYEPLLHIVRNCVSHGIESPQDRVSKGKPASGRVVLEAQSGADLLVIEVRDDGRGLDFDAIRRRGLERGLIKPDMAPSREQLAQLIFQPGFSTREVASELAGRGVGMDVVAATLDRLRGWIQVDSEPERGTTIRLNIPLPSIIQHAMVLRSSGQLFALPMQFVRGAGGDPDGCVPIPLAGLFGRGTSLRSASPSRQEKAGELLVLDCGTGAKSESVEVAARRRCVTLSVDEIVGPEELVVRPLPALLKQHPLCSGATLSGMGEMVLVLDAHTVAALGAEHLHALAAGPRSAPLGPGSDSDQRRVETAGVASGTDTCPKTKRVMRPRILVTDDSVTARKRLTRSLLRYDVEIVEANDGSEALELLKDQEFAAVFSDLEMPNIDGLGLLAEIKSRERTRQIPVVIVSSRIEDEFQSRARALGVDGYLGKPIDDEALDRSLGEIPGLGAAIGELISPTLQHGEF